MTCHHRTTTKSQSGTPDIVTYRYDGELVYVPVALDYKQAVSHALDAFPQLKDLRDMSISLSMPGHMQKRVGISAPAWPKIIAHLLRYQIIDVQVTPTEDRAVPNITITYADGEDAMASEPAPPYNRSKDVEDEKAPYPRPQSPSATLHPKRSWFFHKLHAQ